MKNYLHHFFILALLILIVNFLLACYVEPLYGDLTRTGKWAERDFGANYIQPVLHVKLTSPSQQNPEVLVLGDSFSVENLWQSVVSDKTGFAVKTFGYNSEYGIANFISSSIAEDSSKIIIIETIEREFVKRFSTIKISKKKLHSLEIKAGTKESARPFWPPTFNSPYLLIATINTILLNIFPERIFNEYEVVNTTLKSGCAQFSNRRNDRLLYYAEDDLKRQWSQKDILNAVANVVKIQKEVESHGKKFVFILVPDKSTVYQSCMIGGVDTSKVNLNLNNILISSGVNAPDLLTLLKGKINTIMDLYKPDDTHWSNAGFLLAGQAISQYVSRVFYE